jgi:3-dehydroquinate dehydratase
MWIAYYRDAEGREFEVKSEDLATLNAELLNLIEVKNIDIDSIYVEKIEK